MSVALPEPEPSLDLRLFDSAGDLMCVRDMQGRFVRVNKAWEATLGLSTDDVVKAPLLPLIHPADVPATLQRMAEADRRHAIVNFINRYRRRDGQYRYMEWRAQRFGDLILGRARDVTERRAVEHGLQTANQAIEETLADIGERIKAPSDRILEMARALGRTTLTDEQQAMVVALGTSVQTLERLVAQLFERERQVAWAMFLPILEQRRLSADRPIELRPGPRDTRSIIAEELVPGPVGLDSSSAAVHAWVTESLRHISENGVLHRTLRDHSSRTFGLLSIRLDHLGQFYPRRLQSQTAASGLMSAGRAAALLARMQDVGFVGVVGDYQAGQIRPYRVRPAMLKAIADQLIVDLRYLATSDYRATLAIEAIEADERSAVPILAKLAAALLDDNRAGTKALGNRLNGVLRMAKGHAIALAIYADAIQKHGLDREGWTEFALTSYAKRFDVSRVHVSRVFHQLAPCGLVQDPVSPSRLLVTARFRREVENYVTAVCKVTTGVLESLV